MNLEPSTLGRRVPQGGAIGLVAAACGLAIAELVASASHAFQSPVLDVADRVVDGVPNSVKSLAIEWFGTNDKRALLIGIASILTIYAAAIGVLALGRRWKASIVGIAGFGVVGAYASQTTRRAAPFVAVVPSVVGAGVAAAALWYLRRSCLGAALRSSRRAAGPILDRRVGAERSAPLHRCTRVGHRRGAGGRRIRAKAGHEDERCCIAGIAHAPRGDTTVAGGRAGYQLRRGGCRPVLHRES